MAKMYHIETMKPKGDQAELEALLRDEALPYWRKRGFEVKVYARQYSLGRGELWLFTGMDAFGDIDGWRAKATAEPEGQRIMERLVAAVHDLEASVVRDIEAA